MFGKQKVLVEEEGISLYHFGSFISKELPVFYNPEMKINRDSSLLFIHSYFSKPISYCDPMAASGIRELRFLNTIPKSFNTLTLGDVSKDAIKTMKKHFTLNSIKKNNIHFNHANAISTISSQYYDMIEIDPFGSPVPFMDISLQRIKHKGVISITATDTASLCGRYPKTGLRRYGFKTDFTFWYEEFGLRGLIAYCQREAAKYDKALKVELAYSAKHFYKVFFSVYDNKVGALNSVKEQKYIHWDRQTQEITFSNYEEKNYIGKIYTGSLINKELVESMLNSISIIKDNKQIKKKLELLYDEVDIVGHYNPHKLQKSFKFDSSKKFESMIEELKEKGYEASRAHNNNLGIKTTANYNEIIALMKH